MRPGREAEALKLIRAVKREAEMKQRGTLVYLVHQVLTKQKQPKATRKLCFYERYRNQAALDKHLASASWQAVKSNWPRCFEGTWKKNIKFFGIVRIAAFARRGAIPVAT